jgi:thymidylate synthase
MQQYRALIEKVLNEGVVKPSRPGINTKSIFGHTVEFDLRGRRMPIVTLKETWFHGVKAELCWFLRGKTTRRWLHNHKVHIWDEWDVPYNLDRDVGSVAVHKHNPDMHTPYMGNFTLGGFVPESEEDTKLTLLWLTIMRKAYDPEFVDYDDATKVHPDWHDVATFVAGVKSVPHWNYKVAKWDDFVLSKDWYESDEYSVRSCIWISHEEEEFYTKGSTAISVDLDYDGQPDVYFLKGTDGRIPQESITRMLRNHKPKTGGRSVFGWHYEERTPRPEYVYRFMPIEHGSLGPIYGYQWRHWPKYNGGEVDQVAQVIEGLKTDPHGRRHIISAWNVAQIDEMALPPCHLLIQFYVGGANANELHCHVYQRSCDLFLGVPFNWASYALLTNIIADFVGLKPSRLVWTGGDIHLYENQWEQSKELLKRQMHESPTLKVRNKYASKENNADITFLIPDMFELVGYRHSGKLSAPVAV